jgi:hypothetical protein
MLGEGGAGGEGLTCVGMSRGNLLILPNLDEVLSPPTCWPAQAKRCTWMQEELEGLHQTLVSACGRGGASGVGGGVEAEEIGEGGGVGGGIGAHRDRAEAAEQDQRLLACTCASAAVAAQGTGGEWREALIGRLTLLVSACTYMKDEGPCAPPPHDAPPPAAAACPAPLGGIVRLAAAPRGQRRGQPGRIHMWCMRFAWRAAVGQQCTRPRVARGTRRAALWMALGAHGTARGAVFGARGQKLDCVDVGRTLIV